MIRVLYPGTFDPPTNGHINIIKRAAKIFDKLEIVIANNSTKKWLFTAEERFNMLKHIIKEYNNVNLYIWDKIIVDFAVKFCQFFLDFVCILP